MRSPSVSFVGAAARGLRARGKAGDKRFYGTLHSALGRAGWGLEFFESADAFLARRARFEGAVVLLYNECLDDQAEVAATERSIRRAWPDAAIVHAAATGAVLGVKPRCHGYLAGLGVPVPPIARGPKHPAAVFSNHAAATHARVEVVQAGAALDPERHNTELIDTRHRVRGKDWYTAFRVHACGTVVTAFYPMFRPEADGDPSVHAGDIPRRAALINDFQFGVLPQYAREAHDIAALAGAALGPGFWHFDLLPCARSRRLYVSEAGIKVTPTGHLARLKPYSRELFGFCGTLDGEYAQRAARAFAASLPEASCA